MSLFQDERPGILLLLRSMLALLLADPKSYTTMSGESLTCHVFTCCPDLESSTPINHIPIQYAIWLRPKSLGYDKSLYLIPCKVYNPSIS